MEGNLATNGQTTETTTSSGTEQDTPAGGRIAWSNPRNASIIGRKAQTPKQSGGEAPKAAVGTEAEGQADAQGSDGGKEASKEEGKGEAQKDEIVEFKMGSKTYRMPREAFEQIKELERASQARMREAAETKKRYESMSTDELLKLRGMDPDQWAEERLIQALEKSKLTPEQIELQELRAKMKAEEETKKERQAREEAERLNQASQLERQKIVQEFTSAWANSGLPSHPYFGALVAAELLRAETNGSPLTMQEAAAKIKKDYFKHSREILGKLNPSQLQEILGDEPLKKWREFDVSRVVQAQQKTEAPKSKPIFRPGAEPASQKRTVFSENEWRSWRDSGLDLETWKAKYKKS